MINRTTKAGLACAGAFFASTSAFAAESGPKRVGECVATTIKSVETRLTDGSTNTPVPGSGSAVSFANGLYQVSYDTIPAIEHSRRGDPVKICLTSIPRDCPAGDDRGKIYATTNLRTRQHWQLPNAEHGCGGA